MYNIYTSSKSLLASAAFATALVCSGSAFAGPGKPGNYEIVPGGNILDIALAVNAGGLEEFDYLLAAVGCLTDEWGNNPVIDLLTGSDKYTLFAPTDSAFENLQEALGIEVPDPATTCAVDTIFGEGTLFTILAYHVTEGRRFTNSVFNKNSNKQVEMLAGGYITTTPELQIIDGVQQVIAPVLPLVNINASNGVIHVIDTVMLPFNPFTP
jgi:transforming growth factor-beta-induced protein